MDLEKEVHRFVVVGGYGFEFNLEKYMHERFSN